jgi:hypothetical protein
MTLSRHLITLFTLKNVRPALVARRTKLDPSVFTRIKKGGSISIETLVEILTTGLGYSQRNKEYLEAMSLWMAESTRTNATEKMSKRIGSAGKARDQKDKELTSRLVELSDSLSDNEKAMLLEALRKPDALRLWMQSVSAMSTTQRPAAVKDLIV